MGHRVAIGGIFTECNQFGGERIDMDWFARYDLRRGDEILGLFDDRDDVALIPFDDRVYPAGPMALDRLGFAVADLEHGPITVNEMYPMILAAERRGIRLM